MIILYIIIVIGVLLTVLMCWQESKKRKISFIPAVLLCILLSPFLGYFIIQLKPLRTAKGCKWCQNHQNEAEYCGICGKNEAGNLRSS